jgi:hypothetical protein
MSLLRGVLAFVISSLFIITLYLTINSYTLGNLLQKENIKDFLQVQMTNDLAAENCESYCDYLGNESQPAYTENYSDNILKQRCIDDCVSRTSKSQEYLSQTVDSIYGREIINGVSLNSVAGMMSNNILMVILTIVLGVSLFLTAEKPISKMGNNLIIVAISLLSMAVVPIFIVSPENSALRIVSEYMFQGIYQQIIIGAILVAIGIVLAILGKKRNR